MRFPRVLPSNQISVDLNNGSAGFSFHDISAAADLLYAMEGLLEKSVIRSRGTIDNDTVRIFYYFLGN